MYCIRTFYAKFRPYYIRSDQQHPCVGVKGVLICRIRNQKQKDEGAKREPVTKTDLAEKIGVRCG